LNESFSGCLLQPEEPIEAKATLRRTDYFDLEGGRSRPEHSGPCPKTWHQRKTFYRWKSKYGGMELSDAKRLKQLEEENRRLKRLVADQALDIQGY